MKINQAKTRLGSGSGADYFCKQCLLKSFFYVIIIRRFDITEYFRFIVPVGFVYGVRQILMPSFTQLNSSNLSYSKCDNISSGTNNLINSVSIRQRYKQRINLGITLNRKKNDL